MSLSPEIRRLLQKTLKIKGSDVPLHRVLDILATEDGDVSEVVNRFSDIENKALRTAFHHCAVLLRMLEAQAGLTPSWEGVGAAEPSQGAADHTSSNNSSSEAKPTPKPRFSPQELQPFVDETQRGKVSIAKVYVDGASRGNPGPAGIGVALFTMDGKKIAQISRPIGTTTNNAAEYTALIEALKLAKELGIQQLHVLSDSQLMVNQMTGRYKVKNPQIAEFVAQAMGLVKQFPKVSFHFIERENNRLADALSTAPLAKPARQKVDTSTKALMALLDDNPDEGRTE